MEKMPNKKIAVLSFPYHNGLINDGSSIVQERLTTYFVETGKVEVIERKLLDKIIGEMKLKVTGVIDKNDTQKLGKILGVGAIVTGTLNDVSAKKTEVNARIIQTETGKIFAAGRAKIKRTWNNSPVKPDPPPKPPKPKDNLSGSPLIQMAILLDTSGSMQGLINQARSQIWKIVNELASSEKDGNNPLIQLALYEYGNDRISRDENYLRQLLPFSADLDIVSEKLFSLTTNGGSEYCGAVIMDAADNLQWDKGADVYKVIFIAGNEPFTQGTVNYTDAIAAAKKKDIFVNTIFCGRRQQGIATGWQDGALLAGGDYLSIDQRARIVAIQAPQDEEIGRLGRELNDTFIFYGGKGAVAKKEQEAQDKNVVALKESGSYLQRALFKAKAQYSSNVSGDLVNAVKEEKIKLKDIKKEELPPELQKMDKEELEKYVQDKISERKKIQDKISNLNDERRKYVADERKKQAGASGEQTLDQAVSEAVRTQAEKKKFKFKSE
ncbi:VWA domain-containing protein [bacterium]|nr:VWA domain-containing protein [bacterium]